MIKAHLTDSRGVYLRTVEVYPLGPQPVGAQYGSLPAPIEGCGLVWRGQWVQVPSEELLPTPQPIQPNHLRTALTTEYESRMAVIAEGYPPSERESWPVQTSEAYALLSDSTASTPWIDAAASARGLDRIELAQRIVAKDAQYRIISGTLSGIRQRIEDQIDAAVDDQAALQVIDVNQGWPE